MKGQLQKISQDTSQMADRTEADNKFGGQTIIGITENNFTNIEQRNFSMFMCKLGNRRVPNGMHGGVRGR